MASFYIHTVRSKLDEAGNGLNIFMAFPWDEKCRFFACAALQCFLITVPGPRLSLFDEGVYQQEQLNLARNKFLTVQSETLSGKPRDLRLNDIL